MKDLGKKREVMHPSSVDTEKDKIIYPSIDLPLSIIEGLGLKVDDDVEVHIKGRVSGLQDTEWTKSATIEAKQGEVTKAEKKGAKSIMDEYK